MTKIKTRAIEVPGHGKFVVCKYVSRIDVDNGGLGQHGWYVRLPTKEGRVTKFFSDGNSFPGVSLHEAFMFIYDNYSLPVKAPRTGKAVIVVKEKRYNRVVVRVVSPITNRLCKTFYVATIDQATDAKIKVQERKAMRYRRELEKVAVKESRAAAADFLDGVRELAA